MPGGDGTGPRGLGAGIGWGFGPCGAGMRRGFGRGMGFGRGYGWRRLTANPITEPTKEKEMLENQIILLESEQKQISQDIESARKRIEEIK